MRSVPRWRTSLDIVAIIAMIAASLSVVWAVLGPTGPEPPTGRADAGFRIGLREGELMGVATAPLVMMIYSDMQCEFCARFARATLPQIVARYVETGRLRLGFRNYPIEEKHDFALKAAVAMVCAGRQRKLWEMHDAVFGYGGLLTEERVAAAARRIGVQEPEFGRCLASDDAVAVVRREAIEGRRLGVSSTPSFLLGTLGPDGHLDATALFSGARPTEEFVKRIDEVLEGLSSGKSNW